MARPIELAQAWADWRFRKTILSPDLCVGNLRIPDRQSAPAARDAGIIAEVHQPASIAVIYRFGDGSGKSGDVPILPRLSLFTPITVLLQSHWDAMSCRRRAGADQILPQDHKAAFAEEQVCTQAFLPAGLLGQRMSTECVGINDDALLLASDAGELLHHDVTIATITSICP